MNFDFSLLLVVLTFISGAIWSIDAWFFRGRRDDGRESAEPVIVEYARSFFPILFIVLLVRSFLFEPFRIPSSSMVPTLLVGDFIFVNKYTYGLRLPVVNTKILEIGDPERGDVVVFRLPADPSTNYIKRLVGLPGDTVRYQNSQLFINDELVGVERLGEFTENSQPGADLYNERLGDVEHNILLMPGRGSAEGIFVVPPGNYFMMGDNRDNSQDSRFQRVGFVPEGNVVGKAVRVWMNWSIPNMPRWNRIGQAIN